MTLAATFPPKPKAFAAAFPPSPPPSTSPNVSAESASPATMQQGTGTALLVKAGPDCPISSPSYPSSEGQTPKGFARGNTDPLAGVKPTPADAGVEGVDSGALGVCTLLASTGSDQGRQSGVGSGSGGAIVTSDPAAEGSDSVDWEAVRLAPRSKVEISVTNHDNCCWGRGAGQEGGEGN